MNTKQDNITCIYSIDDEKIYVNELKEELKNPISKKNIQIVILSHNLNKEKNKGFKGRRAKICHKTWQSYHNSE